MNLGLSGRLTRATIKSPLTPLLLLAADNPDGELTQYEAFGANQAALALSRNFAVIGRF